MKAFGKILGLVFLGLLLILVALGFALTHFFDPNDYKDEIKQIARDKANLELDLRGDIGWSLFPWLGIELHDATLASATTPEKPFANLQMIGLSVRVLPLLRKEVEMSDIRVQGLDLTLQRDEKGHGNWENVGRPATASADVQPEPASTPAQTQPNSTRSGSPLKLDIDSLTVNDSRIDYHDVRSGQQFAAEGIEVSTGAIREGSSIPLKMSFHLSTAKPVTRSQAEISGELRFDRALERYQLDNASVTGDISGEPFNGKAINFSTQGQLLVDRAAQIAEWTNMKLSANDLRALGDFRVRQLENDPQIEGALSIAELNLRTFLDSVGIELPKMAAADALSRFEMTTRLQGSTNSVTLDELKLGLDGSSLTGNVAVTDLQKQALRLQLKGDQLDADRYLPPSEDDAARKQRQATVAQSTGGAGTTPLPDKPSEQAWSDAPVLPIDRLRTLNMQVALDLGKLTVKKIPMEGVSLRSSANDGDLQIQNLRGSLDGGDFQSSARVDVRPAQPQLSLKASTSGVPVERFLQKEEQPSPLKGALDLNLAFTTSGNSERAWVEALNGNANFLLNDGVLVDANLEQQLCRGIALLNRENLAGEPRSKDTPFRELKGALNVRNGVANNPDLRARIPGLTVNGNGDLDLRVMGMDYRVGIVIDGDQREMPDPACTVNERYVGIEWPLRCRGPVELGARACRIDQEGMGKVAAKLAGNKLEEKIDEKLGDKVSPELRDALKGLFNR
ncbi:AsmA family protein [Pseudomonas matsuisoli]|uniref:AsmA domain-containing protein n=1 Tax=Pseudomonas matsuisoli TaxID=1515666 RepID=A0A917PLY7_9PSED|nr:AsmA family protein [Pseudomonas matsuisoli]GGJ83629.1 hypothetical protein GCM10009304_06980 [Pseudomonas matsuisoli]